MLNGNRREFHIFMTGDGKKKQQMLENAFAKVEMQALTDVSEEELNSFMTVAKKIYDNLKK